MKKLSLIAAALAVAASGAFAATTSDDFNVTINFTGSCAVKTAANNVTLDYPAFSPVAVPGDGPATTVVQCSRGLAPTGFVLNTGADMTAGASVAPGGAITGAGMIAGIQYTLNGTTGLTQTGTPASPTSPGSADEYTISINVSAPANQAGAGASGTGTQLRTLTITY